ELFYRDRILEGLKFCKNRLYIKGNGLFNDGYDHKYHKVTNPYNIDRNEGVVGRPLEDDSIFLKAWKLTGDENYKAIFWETLERLIKEEDPPGNWINYFPCNPMKGDIHPRHAFWWGRPFIRAYEETSDEKLKKKYLDVAIRAGEWYKKAIRKDGGLFRRTYIDFNTDSFGHATSGSACAAILWMELKNITKNKEYNSYIRNSINHCMQMQFVEPNLSDKNLLGCVLEKILPPNGSDKNPYYIRDLGTIFFIQAAVKYLKTFN
ncbi:MAG: hypothetical protein GY870_02665, partial [archaeon]|nr:hypothetical protein [archaeon]